MFQSNPEHRPEVTALIANTHMTFFTAQRSDQAHGF
jgi:hypothetical protein